MFSMPVIYHSSMKAEDGCIGTLHLNALNGSSGVLDVSSSEYISSSYRHGTFGKPLPPSSNYVDTRRQNDNNAGFCKTLMYSRSASSLSSLVAPSYTAVQSKPIKSQTESQAAPEMKDFIGPRRSSLDLNATFINTHRRYEDRSFSVVEQMVGPSSRLSRHFNRPAVDRRMVADVNLTALRINQSIVNTTDYRGRDSKFSVLDSKISTLDSNLSSSDSNLPILGSTAKSCEVDSRKSHEHSSKTTMPGKTRKFLEKIKSNITDYNIHFRQSRGRSDSKPDEKTVQISTSKSGNLQQKKPRHDVDSTTHHNGSRHREGAHAL